MQKYIIILALYQDELLENCIEIIPEEIKSLEEAVQEQQSASEGRRLTVYKN